MDDIEMQMANMNIENEKNGELAFDEGVEKELSRYSNHHIDMEFLENNIASWRLSCYYGYLERTQRRESWDIILRLERISSITWCIWGDFKDLYFPLIGKEGLTTPSVSLMVFRNMLEECQLSEFTLNGGKFIWKRGRRTNDWVIEKLDHYFANASWWVNFLLYN
ncbi:uncharacterized protein LOC141691961 [Apium graveolens]|uniref:uncharacterized protein LOC141691961 n=1 Tax=Apium graveolens TaxID=4045 RepID=UPI003D7AC4D7